MARPLKNAAIPAAPAERIPSRYWNNKGRDTLRIFPSMLERDEDLLKNAGPRSQHLWRTVHLPALIKWYGALQRQRQVSCADREMRSLELSIGLTPLANLEIGDITPKLLARYVRALRQERPRAVESLVKLIKRMFRLADQEHVVSPSPALRLTHKLANTARGRRPQRRATGSRPNKAPRQPSPGYLDAMREAALAWEKVIVGLLDLAGLSANEAIGLRRADIDLYKRKINISHWYQFGEIVPYEKTSRIRSVPLPDALLADIVRLEVVRTRPQTFESQRDAYVLPYMFARGTLAGLARRAGLKKTYPPEALRNVAICRWLREGLSLYEVMERLGRLETYALAVKFQAELRQLASAERHAALAEVLGAMVDADD